MGIFVFLKVWLVLFVYEVSKCFDMWSKAAPNIFQHVDTIGPRVPHRMPKSVQAGAPPEVPKNRSDKNDSPGGDTSANGWIQSGIPNLKIFVGWICNRISNGTGIDFDIICMIYHNAPCGAHTAAT